jgi:RNA-binding protein
MRLLPYNRLMELTERQRKHLRGLAHPLNPVILVGGGGVTEGVIAETDRALHDHELIKVKVRGAERADRDAMLARLAGATRSALVTRIGHVAVFYRPRPGNPKIVIPDAPATEGQA